MKKIRERGEGKAGCIFALAILLIAIIIGIKFIPQRIAVSELQDFTVKEAERASLVQVRDGQTREQIIADSILRKAVELRLPLSREALKVEINQSRILVEGRYTIDVNLLVTTYKWTIPINVDRMLF